MAEQRSPKPRVGGSNPSWPAINFTNREKKMKIFSRITTFITEVKVEMQKVSWSDRQELIGSTGVVIVSTALLAIFIGIVDIILSKFVGILLK